MNLEGGTAAVELKADSTVADLKMALVKEYPALEPIVQRSSISVDHEYASGESVLNERVEVALIPPVSGG